MVMNPALAGLTCALTLVAGRAVAAEALADAFHAPRLSADCVWNSLPKSLRDAVEAAQTLDDVSAVVSPLDAKGPARMRAIALRCGVPAAGPEPAEVAQHVVVAKSLEIWSANQLKAGYGVGPEALARAYGATPPAARAEFARWFIGNLDMSTAPMDAASPMMDALGLAGDDATKLVLFYAASRALVEQMGGTG